MIPSSGFTLIELLIAVAVVGILAAIAYPSYQDAVRTSRRADAMGALASAQLAQEKWRANDTDYATAAELPIDGTSPDGYYSLTVQRAITNTTSCTLDANSPSATAYAIKATGQNGQQNDTGCAAVCVDERGIIYPSGCIKP